MYKAVLIAVAAAALAAPAAAQQTEPFEPIVPSQSEPAGPPANDVPSKHAIAPELLSERQVREIQKALDAHGTPMQVDGQWGPVMDAAVRIFQKNENLISQNGELDPLTLMALGLNPLTFGLSEMDETTGQASPGTAASPAEPHDPARDLGTNNPPEDRPAGSDQDDR